MEKKLLRFATIVFVSLFVHYAYAQKGYTYKCVEMYNYGAPWPLEDVTYYIEFSDNGLTRWTLRDGEWKYPEWYDFVNKFDGGTQYMRKYYIMTNVYCADHYEFSTDLSILKRYYRCPESTYQFDYIFKRVK